jgi:transcriptional regulator with XRE-family HTH domain
MPRRPHFIGEWRAAKKKTQTEIARRLGMSEASVSRIEDGKQPYTQDTLEGIADALGEDPWILISQGPGAATAENNLDQRVLELSITLALRYRPESEPAQIARDARVLYRLLVEKKAKGDPMNDATAAQAMLDELIERGDV